MRIERVQPQTVPVGGNVLGEIGRTRVVAEFSISDLGDRLERFLVDLVRGGERS